MLARIERPGTLAEWRSVSHSGVAVLEEHGMTYDYLEVEGGDHGNVIGIGMPTIFEFFDDHRKPRSR